MEKTKAGKHASKRLSPASTVLLTVAGTLLAIVVIRIMIFIFTGR